MRIIFILTGLLVSPEAFAHVKWFSNFSYDQAPISFSEISQPSALILILLSVVTVSFFVVCDRWLEAWGPYNRLNHFLASYGNRATGILRIFTGASLLLAWQADSMIAPELLIHGQAAGWFQFALILLLLLGVTTPLAGAGMIALYFYAMTQYGVFHLMDYAVYLGIGYFLLVSNSKSKSLRESRVPALYLGLGFSLCWAALEKIFYPMWGLEVLQQAPALTMGLDPAFFLLSCAFVEFSLGYLLLIGLLSRPLALIITLTFFTTTAFFGKTEVVGHTLLHGALLVFIVLGTGEYFRTPIMLHRNRVLRALFAGVNFLVVLALLSLPYRTLSQRAYEQRKSSPPVSEEMHSQ